VRSGATPPRPTSAARRAGPHRRTVDPIAHDLGCAARGQRNDRRTGGERLDAHDPEVVLGREDQTPGGAEQLPQRRLVEVSGEGDVPQRPQ
jgi:hypothetical protein